MYRSCFDKLSTNGGCNCPKLKTLYVKLVHQIGSQQDFNLALCCTQSAFHS
ncbi:hypothetical protein CRENPOLYSF1_1540019 [Crenothrix polyspora]|uniref:Uncharacterized protein n=1 Tax=Crenothrix polyspora TaxID=360316 RepID=A0A1R4H3K0_9GAMM|nr:hypothetical protein CRENPOLYSF1_1540019 [Crenothrix polyspora]